MFKGLTVWPHMIVHGFMVSVEICSRWIFVVVFLWRYPPLDSLLFLGMFSCQNNYIYIYRDLWKILYFERILPRQTTSGTLEPTWEMIPWRAPLHGPWLRESKELQWYWIRKCNLSQVTWPNAQRKSCVAQNLCPDPKTSCAEEFGVCSNFSCPAVSTWNWFLSPMPALWVTLLGANRCVCLKQLRTLQPMLFLWNNKSPLSIARAHVVGKFSFSRFCAVMFVNHILQEKTLKLAPVTFREFLWVRSGA